MISNKNFTSKFLLFIIWINFICCRRTIIRSTESTHFNDLHCRLLKRAFKATTAETNYETFIMIQLFKVDRSKNCTIKNVYIAVAIPINDKDGMLIKVNENKKSANKGKIQWLEE